MEPLFIRDYLVRLYLLSASLLWGTLGCTPVTPALAEENAPVVFSGSTAVAVLNGLETTGITKRIKLPADASVGQGYSLIADTLRGHAMQVTPEILSASTENAVSYDLTLVESREDLAKALGIDLKASLKAVGGKYSASYSLFESTRFVNERAYVVVKQKVLVSTQTLTSFLLTDAARDRLKSQKTLSDFRSTYGDSFVYRIGKGAELNAVLEYSKDGKETSKSMKASLRAAAGSFSGSLAVNETIKKTAMTRKVRVLYTQTGASVGRPLRPKETESEPSNEGGVLTMSVDAFLGRIRDFPSESRSDEGQKNAATLWGDAIDYGVIEQRPTVLVDIPRLDIELYLSNLGKLKTLVDQKVQEVEEAQNRIDLVTDPDRLIQFRELSVYWPFITDRIDEYAARLVAHPSALHELTGKQLPGIIIFWNPTRKLGALDEKLENPTDESWKQKYGDTAGPMCPLIEPNHGKLIQCLVGAKYAEALPEPEVEKDEATKITTVDIHYFFRGKPPMPESHKTALGNLWAAHGRPVDATADALARNICGNNPFDLKQPFESNGFTYYTVACIKTN
jgi:hypothetical protein